jgi:hypothetical protein
MVRPVTDGPEPATPSLTTRASASSRVPGGHAELPFPRLLIVLTVGRVGLASGLRRHGP